MAAVVEQAACCLNCGEPRPRKDQTAIVVRSLFELLRVPSPHFYACPANHGPGRAAAP